MLFLLYLNKGGAYENIQRNPKRYYQCMRYVLYAGYKGNYKEVIECATRIYIAELQNSKEEK